MATLSEIGNKIRAASQSNAHSSTEVLKRIGELKDKIRAIPQGSVSKADELLEMQTEADHLERMLAVNEGL